jgi:hypothetical protein
VILEGADSSAAAEVVGRLEAALGEGQTATAGCATWDHVEDAAGLLARADADMYRRKPEKHRREHAKGAATT